MYVLMYVYKYSLIVYDKAKIRWCSCRVENILTLGADPLSVPKAPGQSRIFTSIFVP